MSSYVNANNAFSTLAGGMTNVATTFTVAAGQGARFPTVAGTDWSYCTLQNSANVVEIIKITAHAVGTDTFTCTRGQEGTTAVAWVLGDVVECRLTAATAVTTDGTQTLANKTLTAPVMNGTVTTGSTLTLPVHSTAAATIAAHVPQLSQVQSAASMLLGAIAGTVNAITATLTPTLTAYASGQKFTFVPAGTNTGATTINIDTLGAKNVFALGVACTGSELFIGVPVILEYDGTQFNIISVAGKYISSASTVTNFPATTVWGDLTSISLVAGDWDVTGVLLAQINGATFTGDVEVGVSVTSGNFTTGLVIGDNRVTSLPPIAAASVSMAIPNWRLVLTSTTTVYLKYLAVYSAGTPQAAGRISARRWR